MTESLTYEEKVIQSRKNVGQVTREKTETALVPIEENSLRKLSTIG